MSISSPVFQPLLPAATELNLGGTIDYSGNVKVWTGASWEYKPVKYWNGSTWSTKPVKYWNGSTWILST